MGNTDLGGSRYVHKHHTSTQLESHVHSQSKDGRFEKPKRHPTTYFSPECLNAFHIIPQHTDFRKSTALSLSSHHSHGLHSLAPTGFHAAPGHHSDGPTWRARIRIGSSVESGRYGKTSKSWKKSQSGVGELPHLRRSLGSDFVFWAPLLGAAPTDPDGARLRLLFGPFDPSR